MDARFTGYPTGIHGRSHDGAATTAPSAYGIFTAGYGVFWFLGSLIIGKLYDVSIPSLMGFSVVAQLIAIPLSLIVKKRLRGSKTSDKA
ncbi:MAG TPA: hypothetical protein VGS27_09200 [Candidatus Sulfotelmatobacter sp.]|nr:hypothetical protein [Candidatus Sulfotelmatobacter sp.]